MTQSKSFMRCAVAAALVAAFFAFLPFQAAQAQRTSLSDIDRKVDDIQGTLGPKPGASDPNIQEQIDALKQQNDTLLSVICAFPNSPPGTVCNKIVFLTSVSYSADLGGLAGADAKCNAHAGNAGLPGTYKAWLSDSTEAPNTRFNKATVPYVRVDGVRVANDYTDLVSGSIRAPINVTEDGTSPASALTWTNTLQFGQGFTSPPAHCVNWSSISATDFALTGDSSKSSSQWTAAQVEMCNPKRHLYCFQQ